MANLFPCPHCGSKEHEIGNGDAGYTITCHSFACRASTGAWATEAEAVAAWNRRSSPSPTGGEAGAGKPGQFAERVVAACRAYMNTYDVLAPEVREHMQVCMADALRASDALTRLAPLMDEVEAVLEPFAEAADLYDGLAITDDMTISAARIPVGSLRRVRALLTKLQEGGR